MAAVLAEAAMFSTSFEKKNKTKTNEKSKLNQKTTRQFHLSKAVQFHEEKRQNNQQGASGIDSFWS